MKTKIVVASHNQGKVKEIKNLLKPFKFQVYSASDFDIKEPKETGKNIISPRYTHNYQIARYWSGHNSDRGAGVFLICCLEKQTSLHQEIPW